MLRKINLLTRHQRRLLQSHNKRRRRKMKTRKKRRKRIKSLRHPKWYNKV